jgi:hypothetical protein
MAIHAGLSSLNDTLTRIVLHACNMICNMKKWLNHAGLSTLNDILLQKLEKMNHHQEIFFRCASVN